MKAKKDFADPRTSVATTQQHQQQLQSQKASPDQVSTLTSFLQSCMKLLRNQNALNELQKFIASCEALIEEKMLIELEGLEEK